MNAHEYTDPTLVQTLKDTNAPRILTTRTDGTAVYVALADDGETLIEVTP